MLYINKITGDPAQQFSLTGIPGIQIDVTLRYMPRMRLWLMGLALGTEIVNGIVIAAAPNMLRAFRKTLPFGLACLTSNGLDPYRLNDFVSQEANLYLLDAADVATLESSMFT